MANDLPRSKASAWRGTGPNPAKASRSYGWKPTAAGPLPGKSHRGLKLTLLGGGLLVCAALIAWLIWWLFPPKAYCLVLAGSAYTEDLTVPLNPQGWMGLQDLAKLATEGKHPPRVPHAPPLSVVGPEDWTKGLGEGRETQLVVFLALHGGADRQGAYLLLPGGGELRLDAVVRQLATSAKLKDKKVLLVLDASQVESDWPLGLIHHDFARSLKKLDGEVTKAGNLVVMCSADEGQTSWPSEEWRQTVFGHFFREGLRGAAPAASNQLTAKELFEYTRKQTRTWANAARSRPQEPFLLPSGEAGLDRADKMRLAEPNKDYQPADPAKAPGSTFTAPSELTEAWKRHADFARQSPSPAVTTPRHWRRYRETLLRYEQLVRAGDSVTAGAYLQKLADLEKGIEAARRLELSSQRNALPLTHAILGGPAVAPEKEPLADTFRALLRVANDQQRAERWKELCREQQAEGGPEQQRLRNRLIGWLLAEAARDPATNLGPASTLLATVDEVGQARPTEAHWMRMFALYPVAAPGDPRRPPAALATLALHLRRSAEQAALSARAADQLGDTPDHPYSEQLLPLVKPLVDRADRERLPGEDLLFASATSDYNEAAPLLKAARADYEQAHQAALPFRRALALRDQVFADLPYYTRWVARQRLDETAIHELEQLWKSAHDLDRRLERPDAPGNLAELDRAVRGPFEEREGRFRAECEKLKDVQLAERWHENENALSVPLIEPELRMKLLTNSRTISNKVNVEAKSAAEPPAAKRDSAVERQQTTYRARLAAAVLGDRLLDEQADRDHSLPNAATVRQRLSEPDGDGRADQLADVAQQIGRHWRRMGETLDKSDPANPLDPVRAERLARSAADTGREPGAEPALISRRLRVADLLLWLARRAYADHWYGENAAAEPYFRLAGRRYVKDAEQLLAGIDPAPAVQVAEIAAVSRLLDAGRLRWGGPPQAQMTDSNLPLTFSVEGVPPGVPPGFLVVRRTVGAPLKLAEDDPADPPKVNLSNPTYSVVVANARPADAVGMPPTLRLDGFFRGQRLPHETRIDLFQTPDLIWSRATPTGGGGVAMRAPDNIDQGAIAIVLDYSGSMISLAARAANFAIAKAKSGDPLQKDGKILKVERTMRNLLLGLPRGTPLSIRVFSHARVPGTPLGDEKIFEGPVVWSPDDDGPLNRQVMNKLKELTPWGETPLLRSMSNAWKNDFPRDFKGTRTLLVLTDGEDTLDGDGVPAKLKDTFDNADLSIQMVLFDAEPGEKATALKQFAGVERLGKVPGRIWTADKESELADILGQALRPKFRLLKGAAPAEGMPPGGLAANRPSDLFKDLRWSGQVPAGIYTGRVGTSAQEVQLDSGERLLVRLHRDARRMWFERSLFGLEKEYREYPHFPPKSRSPKQSDYWRLAVLQNRLQVTDQDRHLQLMTIVEDTDPKNLDPGRDGVLKQIAPKFVWFEVKANGEKPARTLRVENLAGYAAPAWHLGANGWPADPRQPNNLAVGAAAHLTAWAAREWPETVGRPLTRHPGLTLDKDFTETPEVGGGTVSVKVNVAPFAVRREARINGKVQETSCLVVRLKYPPGKTVFPQLRGLEVSGQEHRFYHQAGTATSLFWPVTAEQANGEFTLDLIAVEDLKNKTKPLDVKLPGSSVEDTDLAPIKLKGKE